MATLVLTAVGTAVGGPIGGAIGAILGQQADAALFAPKAREGPRLTELAVQTSSYGTPLPKIFGRMRAAGTVIWATDLREHRSRGGGRKGGPKTVSYSYSASFAVALSARPIRGLGRIWADGRLLRGGAGDFKVETGYRLYLGDEEQDVDPLIAAIEGIGSAPAYRGLAYAVFENLQLADYGNRIPSLSFEIEADPEPVGIGTIAAALSDGAVVAGETPALVGYAASGDGLRGAIEALAKLTSLSVTDTGDALQLAAASGTPLEIAEQDAGVRTEGGGGPTQTTWIGAASVPGEVGITYLDPARDWQTSLQRATIGDPSAREEQILLPAAIEAGVVKSMAEARLSDLRFARASARVHLSSRFMSARPGMLVRLDGVPSLWRIERWTLHRMVVTLELVRVGAGGAIETTASAGRPTREPDHPHGPTVLRLLDLPLSTSGFETRPHLLAAAAGPEAGWRQAQLSASFDRGVSWQDAGRTAVSAIIGWATALPDATGAARFDEVRSVEVELLNDAMWLESRDDAALVAGANLALIGGELLQFGRVVPLGERRFRLSRLLRGRNGTEWASSAHEAGEPFTLIEPEALLPIELPPALIGGEARVMAQGLGDDLPVIETRSVTGEALRPPAPAHLRAELRAGGDLTISWVRRSRSGWSWLDGGDAPLVEESERYALRLSTSTSTRTIDLIEPTYLYLAADQAADGGGTLVVEVTQLGTFAASRAASTTVERS